MIKAKRPGTVSDYGDIGFIEAKDSNGVYQNLDHIYDNQGNIVFQQGYLNEYQGADDFGIPAIGKPLLDYTIYGNTIQSGTPTPDSPIEPRFVGERTENLFDKDSAVIMSNIALYTDARLTVSSQSYCAYIPCKGNTEYTISKISSARLRVGSTEGIPTPNMLVNNYYSASNTELATITTSENDKYLVIYYYAYNYGDRVPEEDIRATIMVVEGSTAPSSYVPYGYKIPISSAGQTKTIYLGQTPTTRKIKKMFLTGEENWIDNWTAFVVDINSPKVVPLETEITVVSNQYVSMPDMSAGGMTLAPNNIITKRANYPTLAIKDNRFTTAADFKTYLAQQYANGTPVTVWYVLATPEVGIVNEPLAKIGDYADSVNFSQAGVEIPTLPKGLTTVIDVETEVEPSEVDVTYRGSTKPQYDLFLAQNGDSLEAKDGQSLYIGGNP